MKHLKDFIHPDFPIADKRIVIRESVRIVMRDSEGLTPIIFSKKKNHYKIPGGGIDEGEDIQDALKREAIEEAGCEIEVIGEVGEIHEQRTGGEGESSYNLDQISYCYYGKVISKKEPEFTEYEKDRGFTMLWLSFEEAIERFENCVPVSLAAEIMNERDLLFFKEGFQKMQNND